jgi:hypothetical protein
LCCRAISEEKLRLTLYRTMKKFLFILLLLSTLSVSAQQRRIAHQTFDLEGIQGIELKLVDSCTVETWAGNTLLVEITVEMWVGYEEYKTDAPESIFKHFFEKGRYQVSGALEAGNVLRIQSKDAQRAVIRSPKGVCNESVHVRIMVPEDFKKTGERSWRRS